MGLAGRKTKQRFDNDPRNLTWADDASKFGQAYLSKLGWDPSKGLGAAGDGMKTHISVTQRLNLLGIGAGAKQGAEDIAWKQNRDYELVLKRLNAASTKNGEVTEMGAVGVVEEGGFVKADQTMEVVAKSQEPSGERDTKREKKKRKKEKEEKEDGLDITMSVKESKKRRKDRDDRSELSQLEHEKQTPSPTTIRTPVARPMTHRARFLKSKRMALDNPTAMLEILGVASSSASSSSSYPATPTPAFPSPELLSESAFSSLTTSAILSETSTPVEKASNPLDTLTTSNKSMAEYFKEKLAAKSKSSPLSREESCLPDGDSPRRGLGCNSFGNREADSSSTSMGIGFGSNSKQFALMGLGSPAAFDNRSSSSTVQIESNYDDFNEDKNIENTRDKKEGKEKKEKKEKKKKKSRCKEGGENSSEEPCTQVRDFKACEVDHETPTREAIEGIGREKKKKKKKDVVYD